MLYVLKCDVTQKRKRSSFKVWYNEFTIKPLTKKEVLLMNMITQEARKKQAVVKYAEKNGKSQASRIYGVSLSSVKRWCKRYDGTWQSLLEKSHKPHSNPNRHSALAHFGRTFYWKEAGYLLKNGRCFLYKI